MNRIFSRISVLLALWMVSLTGIEAQEWTRFRGPNGTGISTATTVPTKFTEKDFNWKVSLPGVGHSSPVLWGKKLFVTSSEADKGKRHLLCIDVANGKRLWTKSYEFKSYDHHKLNNTAASTPTVDADMVYTAWHAADEVVFVAVDHAGNEKWQKKLGKLDTNHGGATSPIVVGDVVILSIDQEGDAEGFIIGLDRKTGDSRWKYPRKSNRSSPYATPMLYEPKGGSKELIFVSTAHGMTSIDPMSGKKNWEITGLFSLRCVASPILVGDIFFASCGAGNGSRTSVGVRPPTKDRGPELAYNIQRAPNYVPTPIAYNNRIFAWGDGGIITCLKAETGETLWAERVDGNFYGSPICINGKMYAISTRGDLIIVEASDSYKLISKIELGEASHSTPSVADGVLYLRTESQLISVGGKK